MSTPLPFLQQQLGRLLGFPGMEDAAFGPLSYDPKETAPRYELPNYLEDQLAEVRPRIGAPLQPPAAVPGIELPTATPVGGP